MAKVVRLEVIRVGSKAGEPVVGEDDREYCCIGMMKARSYTFPISDSIQWKMSTGGLAVIGMDILLANKTKGGAVSRSSQLRLMMNLCPWCGREIQGEEPEMEEEDEQEQGTADKDV